MARRKSSRYGVQRMDVTWYGDEFLSTIDEYGDEGLFAAGEIVLAEAQRKAPRRRGLLRLSGYISTGSRSTYVRRGYWRREKKPPKGAVTIGFSAPHAHLMEGGRRGRGIVVPTGSVLHEGRIYRNNGKYKRALNINGQLRSRSRYGRLSARPFLHPALEATKETMVIELAAVLRKRLEEKMPEGR